jgi:hypothetical protein
MIETYAYARARCLATRATAIFGKTNLVSGAELPRPRAHLSQRAAGDQGVEGRYAGLRKPRRSPRDHTLARLLRRHRIIQAAIVRFTDYCRAEEDRIFRTGISPIEYESTIPCVWAWVVQAPSSCPCSGVCARTSKSTFRNRCLPILPWKPRPMNWAYPPACRIVWIQVYEGQVYIGFLQDLMETPRLRCL